MSQKKNVKILIQHLLFDTYFPSCDIGLSGDASERPPVCGGGGGDCGGGGRSARVWRSVRIPALGDATQGAGASHRDADAASQSHLILMAILYGISRRTRCARVRHVALSSRTFLLACVDILASQQKKKSPCDSRRFINRGLPILFRHCLFCGLRFALVACTRM